LLELLIPRLRVNSIYDIDIQALWDAGVRGIITDLDNTLVSTNDPLASPQLVDWLKRVKTAGFRIVIVSNNSAGRVKTFSDALAVPSIPRAKKPRAAAFRKAMEMMNVGPEQTVVIGDQMLTDVLGGNRLGLHTILVTPISIGDEGLFTRINRKIEKIALSWMKRKGLMSWED
jgi:hypothetical protein